MKLPELLTDLRLAWCGENHEDLAAEAARKQWTHHQFLQHLMEGEWNRLHGNRVARHIKQARFPVLKALDQFDWNWPRKINRPQIQDLFRLGFLKDKGNVVFIGGVGTGKTHLATALACEACQQDHAVLYTSAVDIVNTLVGAQATDRLKACLKRYTRPEILLIDELGYLPIDKLGADLLFQVFSLRYERGSTLITTNKAFKHWPDIFNGDVTITAAVLDRVLHHAESVVIDGPSYRMRERKVE
ncbi:MAG: IS21-like element helper ATPase IstB [bacterium]|jgi:DNA replication protein DnaC